MFERPILSSQAEQAVSSENHLIRQFTSGVQRTRVRYNLTNFTGGKAHTLGVGAIYGMFD